MLVVSTVDAEQSDRGLSASKPFLHPRIPCSEPLQGVVPDAQALPIGRVEGGATILALDDVVGDEALRCSGGAALAMLDPLTAIAGTAQDVCSPGAMLRGEQLGIGLLGGRAGDTGIDGAHLRFQHANHGISLM